MTSRYSFEGDRDQASDYAAGDDTAWGIDGPPTQRPLASCGHPANEDGECDCSAWPERAPYPTGARWPMDTDQDEYDGWHPFGPDA